VLNGRETSLAIALGVCVAIAGLVYLLDGVSRTPARPELESLQQTILDASRNEAGGADLSVLFDELNARHFGGGLPNIKVLWEDLDRLDVGEYRQNGMTDGKVVLLNASLRDDDAGVRRTLCHELAVPRRNKLGALGFDRAWYSDKRVTFA
jgi:hypothetical protein